MLSLPVAGHEITLVARDNLALGTSEYRLGDIATIETRNRKLARRLEQVVIGRSPVPQQGARISRNAVLARLEAAHRGLRARIEWRGPAWLRLQSVGVAYSGARLAQQALAFLRREIARDHDDFEIAFSGSRRDALLPPGEVRVEPRLAGERPRGARQCVWLDLYVDDRLVQSRPVWFAVTIRDFALVARAAFERGEPLDARGFEKRYLDIARSRGEIVADAAGLAGMRAREPLEPGMLLTRDLLEPLPAVVKGQRVGVAVAVGGVRLQTRAIALSDGRVEQKIRVRSPASGEAYTVVVTGPAQTRVNQ